MASRHLSPIIIRDGIVTSRPIRKYLGHSGDLGREREAFVQSLIHDDPRIIPMSEIEGIYEEMLSVCQELPLKAGYLDNLWITRSGGIVLGECKLFRNPQARREVIVQALDYAQSLQGMSYEEFERKIAVARKEPDFNLWSFATAGTSEKQTDIPTEADFIDGVVRRLRDGRVMVLVIGDGIHEGVEDLLEFLQMHAGIHANLALVDLSFWDLADGSILVIPRLPLKTATIVRGVIQISGSAVTVSVAPPDSRSAPTMPTRATGGSANDYFQQLAKVDPASATVARELYDALPEAGAIVRFSSKFLNFDVLVDDVPRSFFTLGIDGKIVDGTLVAKLKDDARSAHMRALLADFAGCFGGNVEYGAGGYHNFYLPNRDRAKVSALANHIPEVVDIVRRIVAAGAATP